MIVFDVRNQVCQPSLRKNKIGKGARVQKEFYFDSKPQSDIWDGMCNTRTIEQELDACDLEALARDSFLTHIPEGGRVVDGGCGFGKWVIYLKRMGYDIVGIDSNEIAIVKLKDFEVVYHMVLKTMQQDCGWISLSWQPARMPIFSLIVWVEGYHKCPSRYRRGLPSPAFYVQLGR
ncbi:MAG: class I SAM-dependent methyltransferase [Chloroflexi bacterium]|nr:class I SAM-dependent methyltransferase [Chloroflexota bacterium]